jgi:hypothetical protein
MRSSAVLMVAIVAVGCRREASVEPSPPTLSSARVPSDPDGPSFIEGGRYFRRGALELVFKKDVEPAAAASALGSIGLKLPEGALRSSTTMLATPHRTDARSYGARLAGDAVVAAVDSKFTDDELQKFHEHILSDTAYLWVTFRRPMSWSEEARWLRDNYPELVDVFRRDPEFQPDVVAQDGSRLFGGYANPWRSVYRTVLTVPRGQEAELRAKVEKLGIHEKVSYVPFCQPIASCRADFKTCPEGTFCSGMPRFGCYPRGCGAPMCLAARARISTPSGDVDVERLAPGMMVWTRDEHGTRVAAPVARVSSSPVPRDHVVVDLRLEDGRELHVSPGHPAADRSDVLAIHERELYDGSRVVGAKLVPYDGARTYDLLPAGPTGIYWANGIPVGSTLSGSASSDQSGLHATW